MLSGEIRSIARLISRLENAPEQAREALAQLFPRTGRAYTLGVTGAPGSGKSTLVDGLIRQARARDLSVAVLAVDPSSPFSGGALLGDRIRLQHDPRDPRVYVRSMGARGRLGGLAAASRDAVHVLDAAGYGLIIVETVGVGQSELAIAGAADTVLLVLTPGAGDTIQAMKAGILEIADLFVLNKADQEGASRLLRTIRELARDRPPGGWEPPVIQTRAHQDLGLVQVWEAIAGHRAAMEASGELERRRQARLQAELLEALESGLRTDVLPSLRASARFAELRAEVAARARDPAGAARLLLRERLAASDGIP